MKKNDGENYWATVGWFQRLKRNITPDVVRNVLSGGGTPSFRYLLKVSLEKETKQAKKAEKKVAEEAAKERKAAKKKATDALSAAKKAYASATSAANAATAEYDKKCKEAKEKKGKERKVDKSKRDAAASLQIQAEMDLLGCEDEVEKASKSPFNYDDDVSSDAKGVLLRDAETWNKAEFEPVPVQMSVDPEKEMLKVDVNTPAFREGSFIYYVMDPLEQRHGKDLGTNDVANYASAAKPDDEEGGGRYLPVLRSEHIKDIALHHQVDEKKKCTVILQELSQRPKTSLLFEFLSYFGIVMSLALLVFIQLFTNTKPDLDCYKCGPQRQMFLAMRAAQSAGAGGLQIALFAAVGNQFGTKAVTEVAADAPADGNSTEKQKKRDQAELKLHPENVQNTSNKMLACPSWFGPREWPPILFKKVFLVQFDIGTRAFTTKITDMQADNILVCEVIQSDGSDMLPTSKLGNVFYDAVQYLSNVEKPPHAIVFVQPPKPKKKKSHEEAAESGAASGREPGAEEKEPAPTGDAASPIAADKESLVPKPRKLPNEFARDERIKARIAEEEDDHEGYIPALMISVNDAILIKLQISERQEAFLSLSPVPTPSNPPPIQEKDEDTSEGTNGQSEREPEREPDRCETPTVRRLSSKERQHPFDTRVVFDCKTSDVVYRYMSRSSNDSANGRSLDMADAASYKTSSVSLGPLLVQDCIDLKLPGTTEILCYATRKGWYDSEVVRCQFDVWRAASASTDMKPRTSGRLFHESPNEVKFSADAALDSDWIKGLNFIEEEEGELGSKLFYDQISNATAVSSKRFSEEQQVVYVIYKLGISARAPECITNVLDIYEEFRKAKSYEAHTGTVTVTDATALVNVVGTGNVRRRSVGDANTQDNSRRCSFVEAMLVHLKFDRANEMGLQKFNTLDTETFAFSTTENDFADEIEMCLRAIEAVRAGHVSNEDSGEGQALRIYNSRTAAKHEAQALPPPDSRQLPDLGPESKKAVRKELSLLVKRRRAKKATQPSSNAPGGLTVGIVYTVDMNLAAGESATECTLPEEVLQSGLAAQSSWARYWQAGWSKDTVPTYALTKEHDKKQFYYELTDTKEEMVPLLSRLEASKYTITAIALVDGLAPSVPVTTTLTVTGSVMKTDRKQAVEKQRRISMASIGIAIDGGGESDDSFGARTDASEFASDDEEEEAMGFQFVLDDEDDDTGGFAGRLRNQKALEAAWKEEEARLVKGGVPQSQIFLTKAKYQKAAASRASLQVGEVHAPIDNAMKALQEETAVSISREAPAEERVVAARTQQDVKNIHRERRTSLEWQKTTAEELGRTTRENAERRQKERQRLAEEKRRAEALELAEAERIRLEEELETQKAENERIRRLTEQRENELAAFSRGEIFFNLSSVTKN